MHHLSSHIQITLWADSKLTRDQRPHAQHTAQSYPERGVSHTEHGRTVSSRRAGKERSVPSMQVSRRVTPDGSQS